MTIPVWYGFAHRAWILRPNNADEVLSEDLAAAVLSVYELLLPSELSGCVVMY